MENTKEELVKGDLNAVPEDTDKRTSFSSAGPSHSVKNCSSTQDRDCSKALPRGCTAPEKHRLSLSAWRHAELSGLCLLVVIAWVLLSLPIIFYHLQRKAPHTTQEVMCTPDIYTGDVCRDELQNQQDCLSDRLGSSDVYISLRDGDNQEELEMQAMQLLNGLSFIRASPECEKAVLPFLCLYLFGLCDSNGTLYRPSSMDCETISTDVCEREWMAATSFLGQSTLPQCESLPVEPLTCENVTTEGNITTDSGSITRDSSTNTTDTSDSCDLECRDGFYINENACSCLPRCDTWEQYPHFTTVAIDVVVIISAAIGLITGVAVLVISCIRRKRMFVFPSVITVYLTITLVVLASIALIQYTDRSKLSCSSLDLQRSVENTSSFCILAGVVFYYVLLQLALWWFFHVISLFWKIRFPFHARAFESAHHMKYVHIVMVLLALVLPLMPVTATLATTGFGLTRFPAILCTGTNADATFYSLVLPIILLLQVGITLLIVIFWTIHKQHGLFRMKLSKSPFKIGTAERKILIIFCYYIVLGTFALITFTLATKNGDRFSSEVVGYFTCELRGIDSDKPCDRSRFEALSHPVLNCISLILLGIFPGINLIFVVNVEELKRWCGRAHQFRLFSTSGESPSTGSASAIVLKS